MSDMHVFQDHVGSLVSNVGRIGKDVVIADAEYIKNVCVEDFMHVRGALFESDPFVCSVKEHMAAKTDLASQVIDKIDKFCSGEDLNTKFTL